MPEFTYVAVAPTGVESTGSVSAEDERAAAAELRARSLVVMQLKRQEGDVPTAGSAASRARGILFIRARDKIFLYRQLALMLRSGLTLLEALRECALQLDKSPLGAAVVTLGSDIEEGNSLSASMAQQPRVFRRLTVKLVETAEATGELDVVLTRVSEDLERGLELRRSLLTSLMYPAVVLLVSIGVGGLLVVKVIPQFAKFLAGKSLELPWTTALLLDISEFVRTYGWALGLLFVGCTCALALYRATPHGRLRFDTALLRIPIIGKLLQSADTTQLTRTLGMLLESGVTLLEALRIVAGVTTNRAMRTAVEGAAEAVLSGHDLAGGLEGGPFPRLVPQLVSVGERSGSLTDVLDELARFFESELRAAVRRLGAAVEPALILVVGGMVALVYVSFFQALMRAAGSA